jgi:hypothetical protein
MSRYLDYETADSIVHFNAVEGVLNNPIVTLEEATQPLKSLIGPLEKYVWCSKMDTQVDHAPLTHDEAAAINLYTREWEGGLYQNLNKMLRDRNREKLKPYFLYLRLLMSGLSKLPPLKTIVFRGVRLNVTNLYHNRKEVVWWGVSSCTTNVSVLEQPMFLGQEGDRTIFSIQTYSGVAIQKYSAIKSENEVLLSPCTFMAVKNIANLGNGLCMIQVEELQPPFSLFN